MAGIAPLILVVVPFFSMTETQLIGLTKRADLIRAIITLRVIFMAVRLAWMADALCPTKTLCGTTRFQQAKTHIARVGQTFQMHRIM